jgi:O-antigen ligase
MKSNTSNLKDNLAGIIDSCFIILVFALPFISYPFVLNSNKTGKELFFVTVVSAWLFFKVLTGFKNKTLKIHTVDLMMLLFILYVVIHYFLFSYYSFLYDQFWVFTGYIVLFYLFQLSFDKKNKSESVFNFTIKLIWFCCFIESIIALLQKMNFVNAENEYFQIVGTFINPNFLGVYMVIGLIIVFYQILFFEFKNRIAKLLLLISALLMLYVLYLTDSRASWISFVVGVLFLFGSSPKSISFFRTNKKKTITLISVLFFVGVSGLYFLYQLNKDSVDGRTLIRKITISEIKEKPVFGNGIFNFTGIYNNSKAEYFNELQRPWNEIKVANYVSTAFNDYLQIVFEIGILGFVLLGLILFVIIRKIELNPKTRLGLTFMVIFAFLGVFTSVLYNPTAMVFLVWGLSLLVVYGNNRKELLTITNSFCIKGINASFIVMSFLITVVFYLKTQTLIDFKTISEGENQKFYYKINDAKMLLIEDDPFVQFKFGFEKFHEGEDKNGSLMMESSVRNEPVPEANVVLANLYSEQKNFLKTEQLLVLNNGIEPFRFESKENLLKFYIQTNQKEKSIKIAKEIINLPVKIKSNKVAIYKIEAEKYLKNNR